MKKRILIILILIILILPNILALSVSLSTPLIEGKNATLKCTVTDSIAEGIIKLELWHDTTGTFSLSQTNTTEVSSGVEYSFDKLTNLNDGTYSWNCKAFNASNSDFDASSNSTFTISASAPTISPIGDITIDEDTTFSIILSDNVSDDTTSDVDLTFTFTNLNPSILDITIDNSTNNLSFFPILNQNGQTTINITVWDSSLNQASDQFTLTINAVNDAPTNKTDALEDESWFKNKDIEIDLTEYFTDPDNDPLTYSASSPENINVSIDNSTGIATLTPKTDWVGNTSIFFTVYDNNLIFTSNTISLTVKDVKGLNKAPNIDSYAPPSLILDLEINKEQIFTITKSDPDNDNLTVKWYLNSQLVSESDSYTFISNNVGTHNLEVVVSDEALRDSVEWLLNTKESFEEVNFTPTITEKEEFCGNNIVDAGENCGSCPQDVICKEGEICTNNRCTLEKKSNITVIIIVIAIILLIGIVIAFYLYKRKQQELGLEIKPKEAPKKILAPAADIEDFYKEPDIKPKIVLKKPKNHTRVNKVILRTYIREALQRGHSKEKIKSNLLKTGWKEQYIDDALKEFK